MAPIFSGEKTPCFRKIYLFPLIAIIRIIVKTANIVITVIIAKTVITAKGRKLALSYPSRTGQLPPAELSVVARTVR